MAGKFKLFPIGYGRKVKAPFLIELYEDDEVGEHCAEHSRQAAPSNIKESQRSQPKVFDSYSMVSIVLNIPTRLLRSTSKNPSAVSLKCLILILW